MKYFAFVLFSLVLSVSVLAQKSQLAEGQIKGTVTDALTNQPLANVSITLTGKTEGAASDSAGNYDFKKLKPGLYTVQFSLVGYQKKSVYDVQVNNSRPTMVDVALELEAATLGEVKVQALFIKPLESPVSLRTIGSTEIKRNPGANRDISKVIQSLPGVGASVSFRNDIIIRGGAPSESKFYLDGVEIPNINHFTTQGSSGGPVGLINVDYIREVDFYSGAFPANRGNALSGVFEFKQKDGRNDQLGASLTLGSSDFAATLDGPIGEKTTFISSYRYSYLQGLFKVLGLPFLPSYQDFQFKTKTKFGSRHELTFLGLGALDRVKLNFGVEQNERNLYLLANLPVNAQDNYTLGVSYKNFRNKGYSTLVLSRNYLDNRADKYLDNDESKLKTIDYNSKEIENKFRLENTTREQNYRINYGVGAEAITYTTNTFRVLPFKTDNYSSKLNLIKYNAFAQVSRSFINEQLNLSLGFRVDGNTYSDKMRNPLETFSPRFSASYNFTEEISFNFNTGIYYQLPAYTTLGYRDEAGTLINKQVDYIASKQLVGGLEYNTRQGARFTAEGFYKFYTNYPVVNLYGRSIPLANLGADFDVVGNKPVVDLTEGRSYGIEFLAQQRLTKKFYGIMALTLFRSEVKDNAGTFRPSAWNSRYILSLTAGRMFNRNWEIGAKLRYSGGNPFTPYDLAASSLKTNYQIFPQGIPNYDLLNTGRLKDFYQFDIRIDKKYPFKKFNLDLYLDIQNLTYSQYELQPILVLDRTADGAPQDEPLDASRYKTKLLKNENGNILPSIGIIFEL